MSRNVSGRLNVQSRRKHTHPIPMVHKSGLHVAVACDASGALLAMSDCSDESEKSLFVAATAETQPRERAHLQLRRQQMLLTFSTFLLLALLILAGQVISEPRLEISSSSIAKRKKGERAPASLVQQPGADAPGYDFRAR